MLETLRTYRFELYLITFSLLLFGSLFFPLGFFESYINPLLILINVTAGFVLISMRKKARPFYAILFGLLLIFELIRFVINLPEDNDLDIVRYILLSVFYTIVTLEIIMQVWRAKEVNKNVIFGVMGGYVSLGLIAFFLLLGIEIAEPDSFRGLDISGGPSSSDNLLYYAYITLMTIGYGEIVPVKPLAQKAAILIGLWGQFYLVIITAVVVGKYISGRQEID